MNEEDANWARLRAEEAVRLRAWALHDEQCSCVWANHADSFKDAARAELASQ